MGKRKLGRGLDTLIGQRAAGVDVETSGAETESAPPAREGSVFQLSPERIDPNPFQPRQRFAPGELESLKDSIAKTGILQPLVVRPKGDRYEVVAGERRLRAARELGLPAVPVVVQEVGDECMLELALVENIHREDLNPIELAEAFRRLLELRGWTQERLAKELGIGRASVANTIRLLDLPHDMQDALARGRISAGHAKVLLSIDNPEEQRRLFERIAEENLSVRELELVRDVESAPNEAPRAIPEPANRGEGRRRRKGQAQEKKPYVESLEEELSAALGLRVRIRERKGKGVVTIHFATQEEFETIRQRLIGP